MVLEFGILSMDNDYNASLSKAKYKDKLSEFSQMEHKLHKTI